MIVIFSRNVALIRNEKPGYSGLAQAYMPIVRHEPRELRLYGHATSSDNSPHRLTLVEGTG